MKSFSQEVKEHRCPWGAPGKALTCSELVLVLSQQGREEGAQVSLLEEIPVEKRQAVA